MLLRRQFAPIALIAVWLVGGTPSAPAQYADPMGLPSDPIAPMGSSTVPADFDTPLHTTRASSEFSAQPVSAPAQRRGFLSSLGLGGRNRAVPDTSSEVRGTFENPLPSNRAEVVYEQRITPDEQPGRAAATLVPAPGVGSVQSANRRVNFPRDPGDDIDVLKLQIFLDYHGFSVGEIDGRWGYNTERALHFYQGVNSLPQTGQMEDSIINRLNAFQAGYLIEYAVTDADVRGPYFRIPRTYQEQGKIRSLPYESLAEALGERFHSSPNLLKKLNPGVDFDGMRPGTVIVAPNVANGLDDTRGLVAKVRVSKSQKILTAYDARGGLLFYYPCTLGSKYDPLPIGNFRVTGVVFNPHFTYKPWLFWDADKNEPPINIPPGPNSPVGRVWIATSRSSVGIHGTPNPENISKNTSAGCIRMTNWDAVQLARRVRSGTPLEFVP
jgi:lipoprotein-anchoring transpeptidase ErfK/SrfK